MLAAADVCTTIRLGMTPEDETPPQEAESAVEDRSEAQVKGIGTFLEEAEQATKKKKKKKKKDDSSLGTSRGIETMFRTSYRVQLDLTALADNKANIMISINGIILSIMLASLLPNLATLELWVVIPAAVLLMSSTLAIVYAVIAARPRVKSTLISLEDVRERKANILFFGNFAGMPEDEYIDGMVDLLKQTDLLYYNMIRDIYGLGKVLIRKFELLRVAYNIFMGGLVASILLFIVFFLIMRG